MDNVVFTPRGIILPISEFIKEIDGETIDRDDVIRSLTFIPINEFVRQKIPVYGTPGMNMYLIEKYGVPLYTLSGETLLIPYRSDIFLNDLRKSSSAASDTLKKAVLSRLKIAINSAKYKVPKISTISGSFAGKLRDYQKDIVSQICEFAESESPAFPRQCIVSIPCGGGKTVIAICIVASLRRKTIWITPKEFLIGQLEDSTAVFAPELKVSRFPDMSGDIVAVIVNTASMCKPEDLLAIKRAHFGMCIIDETHRIGTQMFSRCMFSCSSDITIGLSATPDRPDGGRSLVESLVGPVMVSMSRNESQGKFDVLVRIRYLEYRFPVPVVYLESGILSFTGTHTRFGEIPERISDIAAVTRELLADNHKIIIFSRIKSILKAISAELTPDVKVGFYVGGSKSQRHLDELKRAEEAPVILSTCAMGSEGLDVHGITAVILETPRKDVRQMVGRCLRVKNKVQRVIVDYRDVTKVPVFRRSERDRDVLYASEDYEVVHERVSIDNMGQDADTDGDKTLERFLLESSDD